MKALDEFVKQSAVCISAFKKKKKKKNSVGTMFHSLDGWINPMVQLGTTRRRKSRAKCSESVPQNHMSREKNDICKMLLSLFLFIFS